MESQSLGRTRQTPAARNHIVYTDHKGRKIPYADKITPEPILNNNTGRDTKADSIRNSYNSQFKVGIYGWRKKCLYVLVMALMFMMIINLALTLWVLKVLDFNSDGMGQLRIVPGGLQLLGQALVLDSLFASSIKSRRGQPITVESSRNFSVSTRDSHGLQQSRLFLGHDRLEVNVARLEVRDARGALLLGAGQDAVTVGAETLTVTSPAGVNLQNAVQTPLVRAPPAKQLVPAGVNLQNAVQTPLVRAPPAKQLVPAGVNLQNAVQTPLVRAPPAKQLVLESPTRSLEMHASQNIALESRAGDISASCLTTFHLKSVAGAIRLDAPSIYMPKLKSALPLPPSTPHSHDPHHQNIYQLCACSNGKLFLAPPHGACAAREESLICR
ncbi:zeta-sarcoglycan-like [Ostrinia nubilalis]|uniref:zeta-sarcoglycan-like n=1 Tax=Ostrinia nubilalis TaxID=29057 RepID=UPI00308235D8